MFAMIFNVTDRAVQYPQLIYSDQTPDQSIQIAFLAIKRLIIEIKHRLIIMNAQERPGTNPEADQLCCVI